MRGGKGVATGSGVLLIVQPILAPLADPEIFLKEVIGTDSAVEAEEITELLRQRFEPKYVLRPYFDRFPDYEHVRVTTGWIEGSIGDRTVVDDGRPTGKRGGLSRMLRPSSPLWIGEGVRGWLSYEMVRPELTLITLDETVAEYARLHQLERQIRMAEEAERLQQVHKREQEWQTELEHFQRQKSTVTNEREFTAVISEIGSSGKTVGIVTHVKELAEHAPVRFEVTKDAGGATIARVDS